MLEKDFQNKYVIPFLKQNNIYYIKIWGGRISTCRYTGHHNLFKWIIHSNRIENRCRKTNCITAMEHRRNKKIRRTSYCIKTKPI